MAGYGLPKELTRGYAGSVADSLKPANVAPLRTLTQQDLDALDRAEDAAA